jgi:hypothetical protein
MLSDISADQERQYQACLTWAHSSELQCRHIYLDNSTADIALRLFGDKDFMSILAVAIGLPIVLLWIIGGTVIIGAKWIARGSRTLLHGTGMAGAPGVFRRLARWS